MYISYFRITAGIRRVLFSFVYKQTKKEAKIKKIGPSRQGFLKIMIIITINATNCRRGPHPVHPLSVRCILESFGTDF
jgi:hypothetical protein